MAESKSQSGISRSAAAVAALIACSIDGDREAIDRGMAYLVGFSTKGAATAHFYYGAYYAAQALRGTGGDRANRSTLPCATPSWECKNRTAPGPEKLPTPMPPRPP